MGEIKGNKKSVSGLGSKWIHQKVKPTWETIKPKPSTQQRIHQWFQRQRVNSHGDRSASPPWGLCIAWSSQEAWERTARTGAHTRVPFRIDETQLLKPGSNSLFLTFINRGADTYITPKRKDDWYNEGHHYLPTGLKRACREQPSQHLPKC